MSCARAFMLAAAVWESSMASHTFAKVFISISSSSVLLDSALGLAIDPCGQSRASFSETHAARRPLRETSLHISIETRPSHPEHEFRGRHCPRLTSASRRLAPRHSVPYPTDILFHAERLAENHADHPKKSPQMFPV